MKYIKYLIVVLLFLPNTNQVVAQTKAKINTEKDYVSYFHKEIRKYHDTLSKSLNRYYFFFVKFQIDKHGLIDSVQFSEKQPLLMLEVIKTILSNMEIAIPGNRSENIWFIQPIEFNFYPNPLSQIIDDEIYLCFKLPKVDTIYNESSFNFNYNNFFLVNEKVFWGIKSVFLPPLKHQRTIAYH